MKRIVASMVVILSVLLLCVGCQSVDQEKVDAFTTSLQRETITTTDIEKMIADYEALNDAEKEQVGTTTLEGLQYALTISEAVDTALQTSDFTSLADIFTDVSAIPAGVRSRCLDALNSRALSLVYVSSTDVIDRPDDADIMNEIADAMTALDADVAYTQYISLYKECVEIVFDNRDTIEQAGDAAACFDLLDTIDRLTSIDNVFDYGPGYTYFRSPESRELFMHNAQELRDLDISVVPVEHRDDIATFLSDYYMSAQALVNAIDQENSERIVSALSSQQAALSDFQATIEAFLEPAINLITDLDVSVTSMRERYINLLVDP